MKLSNLYLILPLFFIFSACCKAVLPSVELVIEDNSNNNLLSSAQVTDSTWNWYKTEANQYPLEIVSTSEGSALLISTNSIESGQDSYIKLNNSDVDTINIIYEIKGRKCNMRVKVDHFFYNGKRFEGNGSDGKLKAIKY